MKFCKKSQTQNKKTKSNKKTLPAKPLLTAKSSCKQKQTRKLYLQSHCSLPSQAVNKIKQEIFPCKVISACQTNQVFLKTSNLKSYVSIVKPGVFKHSQLKLWQTHKNNATRCRANLQIISSFFGGSRIYYFQWTSIRITNTLKHWTQFTNKIMRQLFSCCLVSSFWIPFPIKLNDK